MSVKKKNWFMVSLLSLILLVGACSDTKKEDAAVEAEEKPADIEETEPEVEEELEEEKEEVENEETAVSTDGEMLNTYLAETTGGDH